MNISNILPYKLNKINLKNNLPVKCDIDLDRYQISHLIVIDLESLQN